VVGLICTRDVPGTKWREISMSFYDRRSRGPDAYERNTRLFRLYYRAVLIFGVIVLISGIQSLL
jgi:hypothetical protein